MDTSSAWFLGATSVSNGTAELQAVAESLFFLLRLATERTEQRDNACEDPLNPTYLPTLNKFQSHEVLGGKGYFAPGCDLCGGALQ